MKPIHFHYPEWFHPFLYPFTYKSACGGRGSGKSESFARLAVHRMANHFSDPANLETKIVLENGFSTHLPYYPEGQVKILSGRQFGVSLKDSVKQVLDNYIEESGLSHEFIIHHKKIEHKDTKSQCVFAGIDRNTNSLRSFHGFNIWWFEEAQFLTQNQMQVIEPTARTEIVCPYTGLLYPPEFWFSWNPDLRSSYTWLNLAEKYGEDLLHVHVNYYWNPWLPEVLRKQAEAMRISDPDLFAHVWEGQPDDSNADQQILPYQLIKNCVDAWDKRPQIHPTMRTDMGLDVAGQGRDLCCAVVRTGPIVHDIKLWKGGMDLNETAHRSMEFYKNICSEHNLKPSRIFYDASHQMEGGFKIMKDRFAPNEAVNFGGSPTGEDQYWDGYTTNKEIFDKRNIQMATAVRQRALQTHRLTNNKSVKIKDCLFINPKIKGLEKMIGMMTQPTRRIITSGKWEIDKRGGDDNAKSPDEFDGLCLAFAHDSYYGLEAKSN